MVNFLRFANIILRAQEHNNKTSDPGTVYHCVAEILCHGGTNCPVMGRKFYGEKIPNVSHYIWEFLKTITSHLYLIRERFVLKLKFENVKFDFCLFAAPQQHLHRMMA